jgi:tetratricopeptide (TPR) repeat protein
MGMAPESQNWPGDGVTFEVLVNDQPVFAEHLTKDMAQLGWQERTVDLSPWAGQTVNLMLRTTPGPKGDATGDWAGWGEPQVVDAQLPQLAALDPGRRMVDEWRQAGVTAQTFFDAGDVAQKYGQLEEAWKRYEQSIRMDPDWEEPYERLRGTLRGDRIAHAYLTTGEQRALERARWLRPSDLYANYHLWQSAVQAGDGESAQVYRETLTDFSLEAISPADERLLDFAVQVIPALMEEGLWSWQKTLYTVAFLVSRHHQVDSVEELLRQLIGRYPTEPEWYFYLGELYQRRGECEQADALYGKPTQ